MNYSAFSEIITYEDLEDALSEFSKFSNNLNKTGNFTNVTSRYETVLTKFFEQNNVSELDAKIKAIATALDYLKKIEVLTIEISFEPSHKFVKKIYILLKNDIKEIFLLKIKRNIALTLGAKIEFNGKIFSYTLADIIK